MEALRDALSGKKTYIVGAVIVLLAVLEGPLGIDVPGVEVGDDWLAFALNGLGLSTLRRGLAKAAA